jgi:nitrate reductase beta subunit
LRIKAQISMVMNLDKCLGCHTCSITCKNAWTNRKGTEYMYFNNVETRPGVGYPKGWEDQERWQGGWKLKDGKLELRIGGKVQRFVKLFYNPDQPVMDDYFEPWTYDYDELISAKRKKHQPVARPRSLVTGERMDITWGPNWDDDLAGTKYARQDRNLEAANTKLQAQEQGEAIKMDVRDLFMKYLPRTCNHCLNPACVAACPSGAIYKRDEDGVVVISQDRCRGWRACVPACPYKKVFYNWQTNKSEKCTFCYPRLESGMPTVCADTCVGRLRYMGVLLYDLDKVEAAAKTADPVKIFASIKDVIADPNDPAVIASARAEGVAESWIQAAQHSPVYLLIKDWELALPLHAEYRTLPMVWYIPPMSPILSRLAAETDMADADEMRIPVAYLAELFSVGDPQPVKAIINKLVAVRLHMRAKEMGDPEPDCDISPEMLDAMYRLLALAKRKDRFNIPAQALPSRSERLCAQRERGFACSSPEGGFAV